MNSISIIRPDDWHLHLRDGAAMRDVLPHTAARFARAIVMPNLRPPVTTVALALAYRDRIRAALPPGSGFEPLMTLYLTDNTHPEEIARAKQSGAVHAVKYYPAGATTNSDAGVTAIGKCFAVLEAMEQYQQKMDKLLNERKVQEAYQAWWDFPVDLRTREVDQKIQQVLERYLPPNFQPTTPVRPAAKNE